MSARFVLFGQCNYFFILNGRLIRVLKEEVRAMLRHIGNEIGDSWFHVHEKTAHCFYLTCRKGVPRHTSWHIGHASSQDLVNWKIHDLVLTQSPTGAWDDRCLATGSILHWKNKFWMAYTGHMTSQVGIACSDDLYSWKRAFDGPVTGVDTRYYEEQGSGSRKMRHWRDPFLFEHDGWIYQYVCASLNHGPADERGTLGVARTHDMAHWEILPPPDIEPVVQELECPQLHKVNGKYYLIFSTATEMFSGAFQAKHSPKELGWSTYSMVAPSPKGPFRIIGTGRILPVSYPVQPYASQLVFWNDKPYLLGTAQLPDGDHVICDPIPLAFTDQGVRLMEN